ncbi:MAG: class I SAM-dependent methyltransferase [Geminicoccaceae bacterium]
MARDEQVINEQDAIQANRSAWNASAPHHLKSERYSRLLKGFAQPGFNCLDNLLTERFEALGVKGKNIAHLCCNNGAEILFVKNLGAARAVGFDQAGEFLKHGEAFRAAGGIDCELIETDVHAIAPSFDGVFDIVLVTIGALGWMPDLPRFIGIVDRLLRNGGALCIHEQHPIMNMMEPWENPDDPARLTHNYFKPQPFEEEGPIVYDGSTAPGGERHYWFVHTLGNIFSACLDQGLMIEHYREYPHNISSTDFDIYNDQPAQLPQCYMLVARKSGFLDVDGSIL